MNITEQTLIEYKENEDLNLHGENYLLLAQAFDDYAAIFMAETYLRVRDSHFASAKMIDLARTEAHDFCNLYYYRLKEVLTEGE